MKTGGQVMTAQQIAFGTKEKKMNRVAKKEPKPVPGRIPLNFKKLSEKILFSGITGKYIAAYGLQYRKNKSFLDIKKAVEKTTKNGYGGKIEYEISFLELYLKDVFKKNRRIHSVR